MSSAVNASGSLTGVRARNAQGFALIDVIFVCGIIGTLAAIAVPRLLLAKQSAGAASAIGSMRAINSGELTFALTCGNGFYAPNLSTLGTPPPGSPEPFIGGGLGASDLVTKSGYLVQVVAIAYPGAPATCNGLAAGEGGRAYIAVADAADPQNTRFFASNANGTIYEHTSSMLAVMPEVGPPPIGHVLY
jgi:type II secretory pathway pseudopilin PulG